MTREEFRDWLDDNNCAIVPVDGINHTGRSVKIYNKQFPSEYTFVPMLPIDDREMPDLVICDACDNLYIPVPPLVNCI